MRRSRAQEPLAKIYREHAPFMLFVAIRDFHVPPGDSESIVHDIFTRYFTNPSIVRGELKPYFRGAVRNGCLEYWRTRDRENGVFCDPDDASAEEVVDERSLAETIATRLAVTETLARLRPRCRDPGKSCRSETDFTRSKIVHHSINERHVPRHLEQNINRDGGVTDRQQH